LHCSEKFAMKSARAWKASRLAEEGGVAAGHFDIHASRRCGGVDGARPAYDAGRSIGTKTPRSDSSGTSLGSTRCVIPDDSSRNDIIDYRCGIRVSTPRSERVGGARYSLFTGTYKGPPYEVRRFLSGWTWCAVTMVSRTAHSSDFKPRGKPLAGVLQWTT